MGSGSSKKKLRHVSTSNLLQLKNDKLSRGRRSISFPSYLASIEGNVEKDDMFLHKKALEDFPSHIDNLTSKTTSLPLTPNGNTYAEFNDMNSPQKLASFSEPSSLPPRVDDDGDIVEDAQLWSLAELYNTLIAESWQGKPQLERDSYLLLLDCRSSEDYKMDHIVTARHHTALHTQFGCLLDVPGQLESFDFIVIYGDGNSNIKEVLQNRNLIFYVLNLPYQTFRSKYPFLCTVEIANTLDKRKEIFKTWPSEILDKCIYQGTAEQALDDTVIQGLGITHIINVTLDHPNAFPDTIKYMRIRLDDVASSDLLTWLPKTTKFISAALNDCHATFKVGDRADSVGSGVESSGNRNRVLIHCNLGRSRSSTVLLGYLMEARKWTLQNACDWLKERRPTVKPNSGFLDQLLLYERQLYGKQLSDFSELPF